MAKSFLKWAGGKSKLLTTILPELATGKRLIEPFVGSGVIFLNSAQKNIIINDFNSDLINVYNQILIDPKVFITAVKAMFDTCNTSVDFYKLRTSFNLLTQPTFNKAVLFVYLNRHSFNGLCRYNASGGFNVPYGRYKTPYLPETEINDFAAFAKNINLTLLTGDFSVPMLMAQPGDVIYCDPPYVPINETSSFTSYSTGGFSAIQQQQIVVLAKAAAKIGAKVLISNHDLPITRDLYKESSRLITLNVTRTISATTAGRGQVKELIAIYE